MFIAPTEPASLKSIGAVSLLPEEYGADILWQSKAGTVGVQRKEFPGDFLASVHDGRLGQQILMMKSLDMGVLLLEGRQNWTMEGQLVRTQHGTGQRWGWDRTQHRNYLASVQAQGIQVHYSDSLADTIDFTLSLQKWTDKGDHTSVSSRPAASGPQWAKLTNADYVQYLYQSFPGIGPKQAKALYDHLGMIFTLAIGEEELTSVPGIGKGRAGKIIRMFGKGR